MLLLSDQPLLVEGLRHLLRQSEELELAAVCYDPMELEPLVEVTAADLLVIDWSPKLHSGILDAMREIAPNIRIVLYLRSLSQDVYDQSRHLGVRGLLDKNMSSEGILESLTDVARGEFVYHTTLGTEFFPAATHPMEPSDAALFGMLAASLSDSQIAQQLGCSLSQAKSEVDGILQRMGFRDRLQIAVDSVLANSSLTASTCTLFTAPRSEAQPKSHDRSQSTR